LIDKGQQNSVYEGFDTTPLRCREELHVDSQASGKTPHNWIYAHDKQCLNWFSRRLCDKNGWPNILRTWTFPIIGLLLPWTFSQLTEKRKPRFTWANLRFTFAQQTSPAQPFFNKLFFWWSISRQLLYNNIKNSKR
jgi:hypothetical protein